MPPQVVSEGGLPGGPVRMRRCLFAPHNGRLTRQRKMTRGLTAKMLARGGLSLKAHLTALRSHDPRLLAHHQLKAPGKDGGGRKEKHPELGCQQHVSERVQMVCTVH